MRKQREPNKGTVNKNLKALVELQWRLNEGMEVSGIGFSKELKLSGAWFGLALKKGIIKKDGKKGKLTIYKWNTKQPDRQMARALTMCISRYNMDLADRREAKKKMKDAHTWVEKVVGEKTPIITGRVSEALKEAVKDMPRPDTRKIDGGSSIEDFPVELEVVKPELRVRYFTKVTTIWFSIFKKTRLYESSEIEI